jgi:hydrogenase/urease accessory protein HupE
MLGLALFALATAHPNSHSSSRVVVEGPRVSLELAVQARSLAEAHDVDADGDGRLARGELAAARGALAAYALERYTLRVGSGGEPGAGAPLPGRLVALEAEAQGAFAGALAEEWVRLELAFEAERAPEELLLEVRLFQEQDPMHFDACELVWNGAPGATFLFGIDGECWWFRPAAERRGGVFAGFFRLGLEHIATGYDHLAFLAALFLAASRARSIVGVATAFTAAHSLALALAVLGAVELPAGLVELSIAMSIAYVGAQNLLVRAPSTRWAEALVFGLVHGLGFATFLERALESEPLVATALVGFNLGVEAGQVVAVSLLAALVHFLPGDRAHGELARAWLAPSWLRRAGSLAVAGLGAFWFLERAGWLPGGN